jgi:hypothetical protein
VLPARLGDAVGDFAALAIAKLAHTNPSASP